MAEQETVEALAEVLADHNDPPGWTVDGDDALVYECACGDQSTPLERDHISPVDAMAADVWHRNHLAQAILTSPAMRDLLARERAATEDSLRMAVASEQALAAIVVQIRALTEAAKKTVHGRLALADQIRALFDSAAPLAPEQPAAAPDARRRPRMSDPTPTDAEMTTGVPALLAEVERLARWKAEALPVLAGLQELGKALGLPLGEQITGPRAAEEAAALLARAEKAEAEVERLRGELSKQWLSAGPALFEQTMDALLARAEKAEAALAAAREALARVEAIHGGTHWCFGGEPQENGTYLSDDVYEPGTEWWPCPTLAALQSAPDEGAGQ